MHQNGAVAQLTSKQATFVEALLAGANLTVAATTAGINRSTAARWQKLDIVSDALKSGQQALFEAALDELLRYVPRALETLRKHMEAEVEPTAATQLHAARALLEQAITIHKMGELAEQLAELKAQVEQMGRRA
jgi:phage terminase small subunit